MIGVSHQLDADVLTYDSLLESIVSDRKNLSLSSVWWLRILSRRGRSPSQHPIPMINTVTYISCRMLKLQDVKVGLCRL